MKMHKIKKSVCFIGALLIMNFTALNYSFGRLNRCAGNNDNECKIYNKRGKLKHDGTGAAISVSIWEVIF
jgi:hypothetical protein